MSTLQATTLLPHDKKITSIHIVAYTDDNEYLDVQATNSFKTIGDFNEFFISNPDYSIHDCDIELENGISISSHDDGEVSVHFQTGHSGQTIIDGIFEKYHLDKKLIDTLKSNPGHYLTIDTESNVTGDYENFEDYLKNGRN
jgi:hypothetical protein